jgi:hypothetical protein
MSKPCLTLAEIDEQSVVELPERQLLAVAVGVGGLAGVAVAIDNVNVPITVEDNQICVNVAAVVAAAGCD